MKGNELIEKILNNEIKSGTLIKMKSNYPALEWEKTLCFNGNWFSEEKYYPGVPRYDDIILHLCSEYMTFEIIEEEKKIPEKLGYQDNADGTFYLNRKKYNSEPIKILSKKMNEIIDTLEMLNDKIK